MSLKEKRDSLGVFDDLYGKELDSMELIVLNRKTLCENHKNWDGVHFLKYIHGKQ